MREPIESGVYEIVDEDDIITEMRPPIDRIRWHAELKRADRELHKAMSCRKENFSDLTDVLEFGMISERHGYYGFEND